MPETRAFWTFGTGYIHRTDPDAIDDILKTVGLQGKDDMTAVMYKLSGAGTEAYCAEVWTTTEKSPYMTGSVYVLAYRGAERYRSPIQAVLDAAAKGAKAMEEEMDKYWGTPLVDATPRSAFQPRMSVDLLFAVPDVRNSGAYRYEVGRTLNDDKIWQSFQFYYPRSNVPGNKPDVFYFRPLFLTDWTDWNPQPIKETES